jgi:hypothetical protein
MRIPKTAACVAALGLIATLQVLAAPVAGADVTPLAISSTLTLNAAPANAKVGDTITMTGTLTFGDASSSAGKTVNLSRDDAAATKTLPSVVTAGDGSYSATAKVVAGGTTTFNAEFLTDGTHDTANASDTVSVNKLSPNVGIRVNDKAVTFGGTVRLTGHLGKGTDSRVLELFAKPDGGHQTLLRKAQVNSDRNLSTSYKPSRDTTFIARYEGDLAHKVSQDSAVTRVRVILKAKMVKFVGTSGKYKLYRGGSYGHCLVHVAPNHNGRNVKGILQAFTGGHWKTVDTGTFPLNAKSTVELLVRGSSNVNFRLKATLPTHTDHIGDSSKWLYLRFK